MRSSQLHDTLMDQWVSVNGYEVHLTMPRVRITTLLPVLYLSGLVVGGHGALPLSTALARHYQTYTPDLPGYGSSTRTKRTLRQEEQADVVAGLLDTLSIETGVIVANSYPAQIAVEVAVRHPQRVQGLVLINPSVDRQARNVWRQLIRFMKNSRQEDALVPGMVGDYLRAGPRRLVETGRYALRYAMEEKLPSVRASSLVIYASNDKIVSKQWAQEVARLVPEGRFLEIEGYAHGIERVGVQALMPVLTSFFTGVNTLSGEASLLPAADARAVLSQTARESSVDVLNCSPLAPVSDKPH